MKVKNKANQNIAILAKIYANRSMEQDRSSEINTHISSPAFFNKDAKEFNGKELSFQQMVLKKMDFNMQKVKIFNPYLTYNNKLKVDFRFKC